jgi:hypothetical protein
MPVAKQSTEAQQKLCMFAKLNHSGVAHVLT